MGTVVVPARDGVFSVPPGARTPPFRRANPWAPIALGRSLAGIQSGLPLPSARNVKVLGLVFDLRCSLTQLADSA